MITDTSRMIADAKRAARRLARTRAESYQECLDIVARHAGRTHWGAFLAEPADVRAMHDDGETPAVLTASSTVKSADDVIPGILESNEPLIVYDPKPQLSEMISGWRDNNGKIFNINSAAFPASQGIVLGIDGTRIIRSSRQSTVLCAGEPGTGKTTGIVLPTIALSTDASQIIHDPKPELINAVITLGLRQHTRIMSLDLLTEATPPGVEQIPFNPLHPEFAAGDDVWQHALRIAEVLIPPCPEGGNDYFEKRGRLLLAALATYLMVRLDRIPQKGARERIASLPALVDWTIHALNTGLDQNLRQAAEDCRGDERLAPALGEIEPLIGMAPNERSGILGTMDKGLLPIKNAQIRRILDPQDANAGAALMHALADPARACTVFVLASQPNAPATATLAALAIDLVTHWRSTQGPSARSLQVIMDEAMKLAPTPAIGRILREGAPAGTALLIVVQPLDMERAKRSWAGADTRSIRADHIVNLLWRATGEDAQTIADLVVDHSKWTPNTIDLQAPEQNHVVIGPRGPVRYWTPRLYPKIRDQKG